MRQLGTPQEVDEAVLAALREVDRYRMGQSDVQVAAVEVARLLGELAVDFAVAGALALNVHGVRRLTEDVDVLIEREGLARFKKHWLGRGYLDVFPGSKALRDTVRGVKIDFLLTGEYPGDGKPKPVAFPSPADAAVPGERFPVVRLEVFLELKLASGMTAPHRPRDLDDVLRLIRARALPREFGQTLHPYVRAKFEELWQLAQHPEEDY